PRGGSRSGCRRARPTCGPRRTRPATEAAATLGSWPASAGSPASAACPTDCLSRRGPPSRLAADSRWGLPYRKSGAHRLPAPAWSHDAAGMDAIEVHGLTKRYGRSVAVDDLTFAVRPGQVTGFLGPNGAGKSTTMRLILGLD